MYLINIIKFFSVSAEVHPHINVVDISLWVLIYILTIVLAIAIESIVRNSISQTISSYEQIFIHDNALITRSRKYITLLDLSPDCVTIFLFFLLISLYLHLVHSGTFILVYLSIWASFVYLFKFSTKISLLHTFIFLGITPLFIVLKKNFYAEGSAIIAFSFLAFATVQIYIEITLDKQQETTPSLFLALYKKSFFYTVTVFIAQCILILLYSQVELIRNQIKTIFKALYKLRPKTIKELVRWAVFSISIVIIFSGIIIGSVRVFTIISGKIAEEQRRQKFISIHPALLKTEPLIVYQGSKVILFGRNFGWHENKKFKIMTSAGELQPDLWTNEKIIFTIPLNWKLGEMTIWIEKPTQWESKEIIVKSSESLIKHIPVSNTFTADDDAYFQQLKTLEDETLLLNGHTPE